MCALLSPDMVHHTRYLYCLIGFLIFLSYKMQSLVRRLQFFFIKNHPNVVMSTNPFSHTSYIFYCSYIVHNSCFYFLVLETVKESVQDVIYIR